MDQDYEQPVDPDDLVTSTRPPPPFLAQSGPQPPPRPSAQQSPPTHPRNHGNQRHQGQPGRPAKSPGTASVPIPSPPPRPSHSNLASQGVVPGTETAPPLPADTSMAPPLPSDNTDTGVGMGMSLSYDQFADHHQVGGGGGGSSETQFDAFTAQDPYEQEAEALGSAPPPRPRTNKPSKPVPPANDANDEHRHVGAGSHGSAPPPLDLGPAPPARPAARKPASIKSSTETDSVDMEHDPDVDAFNSQPPPLNFDGNDYDSNSGAPQAPNRALKSGMFNCVVCVCVCVWKRMGCLRA